jgi:DNA-binding FrmR family transcriptional regulator
MARKNKESKDGQKVKKNKALDMENVLEDGLTESAEGNETVSNASIEPMILTEDQVKLMARLRKVEGQVRGVQKMVEEDRSSMDILVQLSAIRAAMNKVGMSLMEKHTRSCIQHAIKSGKEDKAVDDFMDVLQRFTK